MRGGPGMDERERLLILGLPVDPVGPEQARARVLALVREHPGPLPPEPAGPGGHVPASSDGAPASGGTPVSTGGAPAARSGAPAGDGGADAARRRARHATRLVVTLNPEIAMAAQRDPALRLAVESADLVVADGIGLVWAAAMTGRKLPGRVPGVELLEGLLADAARLGLRVFFLGARPEAVAEAARRAVARFPGLPLVGYHHGYFRPAEEEHVLATVRAAKPDLLFAGMGAERELKWLFRHRERLGARVAMGVGGSFDVLAGRLRRAPAWVRRLHLEWLFRLVQEPGRWRRQAVLPRFAWRVLGEALRLRWGR